MSVSFPQLKITPDETENRPSEATPVDQESRIGSGFRSVFRYALAGAGADLLLSLVEGTDANLQLTAVLEASEHFVFSSYFSINILVGLLLGTALGIFFALATIVAKLFEFPLLKTIKSRFLSTLAAWSAVSCLSAVALNQQPSIHRYIKGIIRELEKLPALNQLLLNHERATSYILLAGLIFACSLVALIATSERMNWFLRSVWIGLLIILLSAGYYLGSRVEVQLYGHSLRSSMFLLEFTSAIGLLGSLYTAFRSRKQGPGPRRGIKAFAVITILVLIGAAFTFWNIDRNQNVKTQLFYRTFLTAHFFKLAQWGLDTDRDSYSRLLGGGDLNDSDASVHPGAREIAEDGIDNNLIGGDVNQAQIDDFLNQRSAINLGAVGPNRPLNVIWIFIDALRADHLGTYGYPRNTSPNIDRFAERATVFENGYTPSPNTYEAFPKFMQSSYWDGHFITWSEVLANNGYNGLMFPRRLPTQLRHIRGMRVVDEARDNQFDAQLTKALDVLSSAPSDKPFAAFLYSTDPHRPYKKHEKFNFGDSLTDLYDGEIAYADEQLGRLFEWMEKTGRINDTMVVIMADHGESLGERGVYRHSSQLYDEQLQVPMIVYVPGMEPRRISTKVNTIDLGATILDAVGFPIPQEYTGVTLMPLIRGGDYVSGYEHPPIFGEQTSDEDSPYVKRHQQLHPKSKKYMVLTQDGYKLIYNRDPNTFELFDLNNDPHEQKNLHGRMPERAAEMREMLGRFIDVVLVSRPWDADESQYFLEGFIDDDKKK